MLTLLVGGAVGCMATGLGSDILLPRVGTWGGVVFGFGAGFLATTLMAYVTLTPFSTRFRWATLFSLLAMDAVVFIYANLAGSHMSTLMGCVVGAGLLTLAVLGLLLLSRKRAHR